MASAPALTAAQWRKIVDDLPPKRRNRQVISAILFRQQSAGSLREVATAYGITRARLSEWETLLEAESVLPKLMRKLGLEGAGWRQWSIGGQAWQKRRNCDAGVTALRLENFGQALRRSR